MSDSSSRGGDGIPGGRVRRTAPLVGLTARTAGEAVVAGLRSKLTGGDPAEFQLLSLHLGGDRSSTATPIP